MKLSWKKIGILAILLALSLTLYLRNVNDFFVSDDFDWLELTKNSQTTWAEKFTGNYYGIHGQGGTFRPMVNVVFAIESAVFGLNPIGYHVTSIVLNALVAFLIFLIISELFKNNENSELIGIISAVIFLVLPSHAEAVVWVSAVADPMATLFYLLSFYTYLIFRTKNQELRTKSNIFSILFFVMALLTKETAITLPVLIFGYELIILRNFGFKSLLSRLSSYFLVLGSFLAYRFWAIGLLFGYYARESLLTVASLKFYAHSFLDFVSGLFFFGKFRLIALEYLIKYWYVLAGFLVLSSLFSLYGLIKSKYKNQIFLSFFWLLNIGLVLPLGMSKLNDEGERYSYLASVALAIGGGWLIVWLWKKVTIIGISLAVLSVAYCAVFLNLKLIRWEDAALISENIVSELGHLNLDKFQKTYFVGLPDNYEGAQVMRNGIIQAANLQLETANLQLERVPIYTILTKQNLNAQLFNPVELWDEGIHTTTVGSQFTLTGNATETHEDYIFELWGYDYSRSLSYTIHLIFNDSLIPDWQSGKLQIVYYDAGGLKTAFRSNNQ